ncbi:hypothetical protein [Mycobacterium parmense]|uniref:Uncharacterized protein n=1 Tax=Mycobacterium parmense TaxID=185642 RepID=A0A7I7YY78_9MYCO|nr:hypothetical protein [Mycobacterium parmense]MCV7352738.1 secretion protein EspK [Mycobacterium parmense]ORW54649.1 hypothetical protein AWC20_19335 [Mycobacterium parmense]BBZ46746.1 hypothetical protein MPRM_40270 [Mycobacterium parmense]
MGLTRPTGDYVAQMLDPGGWPEADEQAFYDRAHEFTQVLRQVTEVLATCRHEHAEIFDGGAWSGGAAGAANGELAKNIDELATLQNGLATVITWHRYVAASIVQAKSDITDNVDAADRRIDLLQRDSSLDAAERTTAINTVISATHGANVCVVDGTAEQIVASRAWKPPGNALEDLLDQKKPPPVTLPDAPSLWPPPVEHDRPRPAPAPPLMAPPVSPVGPGRPAPAVPPLDNGPQWPSPATPSVPGQRPPTSPPAPVEPVPPGPVAAVPGSPGAGPTDALSPAAPAPPLGGGGGSKGLAPAAVQGGSAPQSPGSTTKEDASPSVAPAAATGMPGVPMAPGASGGSTAGAAAGAAAGGGSGAPVGQKSAGAPAGARPAAAGRGAARTGQAARGGPSSAGNKRDDRKEQGDAAAATPIPVSAARAERDAIAEASASAAERRRGGGNDPLRLGRRIAAALNAPGGGGEGYFGFFWVTAVTTDGKIVVANSYGIAYIPEEVRLPEAVRMASADQAIPPAERARWATYPVLAVQGWAAQHNTGLRAVIATEEQLAGSDPGAAKVVLKPDDIPASGVMAGRSRLEVVDPVAAQRLAETPDVRLADLLPPAPVDAKPAADRSAAPAPSMGAEEAALLAASVAAGTTSIEQMLAQFRTGSADLKAPADQRPMLWLEVMKPMTSSATGRQAAHLRAFHSYATHALEASLREAHTAVDPVAQRCAVADWLYWKQLIGVLDAALSEVK